jgi:cytochrome c peroxidase
LKHSAGSSALVIALAGLLGPLLPACGDAPAPPAEPAEAAPADAPAPPAVAPATAEPPDRAALRDRARRVFGSLPDEAANPANPMADEKIALGRMLYYDARLSKNHDVACNSCHQLDKHGVDGEATSPGHKGQRGGRNSPTVYNAAFHVAQFWDGRAADVEEQAKGPVLNPIEMAMPSEAAVLVVLNSIPGYPPLFAAAFPGDEDPVSYDNMARAIGAFERRLATPSRFDAFLEGEDAALSDAELKGLGTFMTVGCHSCHNGAVIGGNAYHKLGVIEPYETEDPGRFAVTGSEADRQVFKVPSLRNIEKTGPWFHDGSKKTLDDTIRTMARHQLGRTLTHEQVESIRSFLASLTGEVDTEYIAMPELPESGPDTPAPDPT